MITLLIISSTLTSFYAQSLFSGARAAPDKATEMEIEQALDYTDPNSLHQVIFEMLSQNEAASVSHQDHDEI